MSTEAGRQKILLITRNLPPLVGGMERLMHNLAKGISVYAQLTVIGPRGCAQHLPTEVRVIEASEKLASFLLISTCLAIHACSKTKYDIVIGGSGLIAPTLRIIARLFGYKTVVYLHGLDLVVRNGLYQRLFIPCIGKIDQVIANSKHTSDTAIEKGVVKQRITVVNPGTELPRMPDHNTVEQFRRHHNISFDRTMLFVGRMTPRKGLSGFITN